MGQPNQASGKALIARQRDGDISTYHFIDNLSRAIRHAGRIIVDLIPSVYTEARIIRVLGEDNEAKTVQVNQQFQNEGDDAPRMYDLTTGKYDVVVKAGPSHSTQRQEAAEQMMLMIQQFPQAAPVIGDLIAKNLDWPGAEEIAERLQKMLPPEIRGRDPEVEQVKQQLQEAAGIIRELQADRSIMQEKNQIDANKVALEAEKVVAQKYKAETDRMSALVKAEAANSTVPQMEAFQPNNLL